MAPQWDGAGLVSQVGPRFPPQTLGGSRAPELMVHFTVDQLVAQMLLLFLSERGSHSA